MFFYGGKGRELLVSENNYFNLRLKRTFANKNIKYDRIVNCFEGLYLITEILRYYDENKAEVSKNVLKKIYTRLIEEDW